MAEAKKKEEVAFKHMVAKARYAGRVCETMGIDKTYCDKAFERLIENMRSGIMALVFE